MTETKTPRGADAIARDVAVIKGTPARIAAVVSARDAAVLRLLDDHTIARVAALTELGETTVKVIKRTYRGGR